jgi:hypothetical protein
MFRSVSSGILTRLVAPASDSIPEITAPATPINTSRRPRRNGFDGSSR